MAAVTKLFPRGFHKFNVGLISRATLNRPKPATLEEFNLDFSSDIIDFNHSNSIDSRPTEYLDPFLERYTSDGPSPRTRTRDLEERKLLISDLQHEVFCYNYCC